jgi:hypothetical protein
VRTTKGRTCSEPASRRPFFLETWLLCCAAVMALGSATPALSQESPPEPTAEAKNPTPPSPTAAQADLERVKELEEAVDRAEAAAEQATRALRALDEAVRKNRRRTQRTGPYFGGAFFTRPKTSTTESS